MRRAARRLLSVPGKFALVGTRMRTARRYTHRDHGWVRAALEAVGVVHEHNFGNENKGYTSIRI